PGRSRGPGPTLRSHAQAPHSRFAGRPRARSRVTLRPESRADRLPRQGLSAARPVRSNWPTWAMQWARYAGLLAAVLAGPVAAIGCSCEEESPAPERAEVPSPPRLPGPPRVLDLPNGSPGESVPIEDAA